MATLEVQAESRQKEAQTLQGKSVSIRYTFFAGLLLQLVCLQLLGHFASRHWHSGRDCAAALIEGKSSTKGTRPGPKSRVHTAKSSSTFTISFRFIVWFYMLKGTGVYGVKVGDMSTISPGAAAAAKPCGGTDFHFSRPSSNNLAKQLVRKRAYRRALTRAQNNGTTMY